MSASIIISVPDLQSLTDNLVTKFDLTKVIFRESITLELLSVIDGEVHLALPRRNVSDIMTVLVSEGICFRYIA